ncbi:hypothetical protein GCM10011578_097790 [Streptomyces fuscichromogenes]|uniref:Uncharacterized protein n=2 Tax=Streptomyces fuscichromogenes TaxID=1324013 RepID=A0A918CXJ0_9ACTN|nr:hypothetical protein GCM10011578_097790 [Streptomyces fuscichromogenes]
MGFFDAVVTMGEVFTPLLLALSGGALSDLTLSLLLSALLVSGGGRALQNIAVGSIFTASVPDTLRPRCRAEELSNWSASVRGHWDLC